MDAIVTKDDVLKKTLMGEPSDPILSNPRRLEYVASCIRIMVGEVRVRSDEERTARATREASA
eukprot:9331027-Prorocentrum_lima.AAC.1